MIIVLGVGNILLKDEGVGVKVVERLSELYEFPDNVELVDGGTQGLWLMATLQRADHVIVIDAVKGGGDPGSLYRLERGDLRKGLRIKATAHDSDLMEALNMLELTEDAPKTVTVIGVEPEDIEPFGLELTPRVAAQTDEMITRVIKELNLYGIEPEKKI
jgi:hydrogenase maturation protease